MGHKANRVNNFRLNKHYFLRIMCNMLNLYMFFIFCYYLTVFFTFRFTVSQLRIFHSKNVILYPVWFRNVYFVVMYVYFALIYVYVMYACCEMILIYMCCMNIKYIFVESNVCILFRLSWGL